MVWRTWWELIVETVVECRENKVSRLAAALAYYALFSLAPLLILVVMFAGVMYDRSSSENVVVNQLSTLAGPEAGDAVRTMLRSIRTPTTDLGTTLIGVVALFLGSSALFHHLKESLNTIWGVTLKPGSGVLSFLRSRGLAIIMVINLGIIALLGLTLSISLESMGQVLSTELPPALPWYLVRGAQILLAFVIITVLVALTFKVLPDTNVAWAVTWIGAAFTAALVVGSQALVALYLHSSQFETAYSLIGAIVIVLIWVYYAALAFLFGASFTSVYAHRYGVKIVPSASAVSLSAGDRAAQGILRTSELAKLAVEQERTVGEDTRPKP